MAKLTKEEQIDNYENLAKSLDELSARFIRETNKLPSETSVIEILEWVKQKTYLRE